MTIDQSIFDQLVASTGGDAAFMHDLMSTYLMDAPQLITQMRQAISANDVDTFRRAAHSLKTTSANFGATSLSDHAKALEQLAGSGSLNGAADGLAPLTAEFKRVQIELMQRAHK